MNEKSHFWTKVTKQTDKEVLDNVKLRLESRQILTDFTRCTFEEFLKEKLSGGWKCYGKEKNNLVYLGVFKSIIDFLWKRIDITHMTEKLSNLEILIIFISYFLLAAALECCWTETDSEQKREWIYCIALRDSILFWTSIRLRPSDLFEMEI